ncbi:MAG: lipopolysaccharide biosynthesis protein [Verrucomicrobiales bacterium]|nr:lipopolysaccharide biosynthesis protein [Verrucomicrobiales bacterium]
MSAAHSSSAASSGSSIAPLGSASTAGVDIADLKEKSVRGGIVTMVSQAVSVCIQLISTAVLGRLLSPKDYGMMAMTMAIVSFGGLFLDLGLSSVAIQKKELTHAQSSNLFWLNVAMGVLLTALVATASPIVVWFYGKPELLWVTVALSFSFVIASIGTQHGARLVRDMQFGKRSLATVSGALVTLVTSVTLALNDFSYWSLVWGNLSGGGVTTMLLFILSPFRPGLMSRGTGVLEMLKFGANITAFDFVNHFQRNLDNILIGRFWGAGPLGLYSRAYSLLMLPITSIRGPINAVAFPALSRLKDDPDAFRSYYLRTTSLIALLSMPLAAYFYVASDPIIELVLGKQWIAVAPIFSCLSLAALIQPAAGFVGSLLLSLGQGKRYFTCGLFNAVFLSICFVVGVGWGPIGVAIAYTVGNYLVLVPWLWWAFRESPVKFVMFGRAISFPICISILGALGALLAQPYLSSYSPFIQLVSLFVVFALTCVPLFFLTQSGRSQISIIRGIFAHVRKSIPKTL